MTVMVNYVYRFTYRLGHLTGGHSEPSNRQRLDGADVLVLELPDDIRARVEALDGTIMLVWQDELTDVATTEPSRFTSWREPSMAAPPLGVDNSPVQHKLDRDRDVADSVAAELAEYLARDLPHIDRADSRAAATYAEGVKDYAAYLATGEATEQLRSLLDL